MAQNYGLEDEALKIYKSHGTLGWNAAEYIARTYVRRGSLNAAWTPIRSNVG